MAKSSEEYEQEIELLKARIYDLETALGQHQKDILAVTFKLRLQESKLLGLLLAVPNVTSEMIQQRLELGANAKTTVYRLRQHMLGYGIKVQSKRGLGYWLDQGTKQRVQAMITPGVAPETTIEEDFAEALDDEVAGAAVTPDVTDQEAA
jgi:hypothetical protein